MIHNAVVLEAQMALVDAIERLNPFARDHYVVIRRREKGNTYWYYFRVQTVHSIALSALKHSPQRQVYTLGEALDLHESDARPVIEECNIPAVQLAQQECVVLNGKKVVGIHIPDIGTNSDSLVKPRPERRTRGKKGTELFAIRLEKGDSVDSAPSDPPRSAFALLECPDVVQASQEFELVEIKRVRSCCVHH